MAFVIRKSLIGKQDIRFFTSASPTFSRNTSYGAATPITAVAATHIPLTNASAYWSANNVERALKESLSRYFLKNHSSATFSAGAGVGDHVNVFGFRNALAATSIQAAASNAFLRDGVARIFVPNGTFTLATPIQLPIKTVIIGNGDGSIFRANATIKPSAMFTMSGKVGATTSNLNANATIGTATISVANGASFSANQDIRITDSQNSELAVIRSIAGNTLTLSNKLRHTYRSAATVKKVEIFYPAKLYMDNLTLQCSNNPGGGNGVNATHLSRSYFGKGLLIDRFNSNGIQLSGNCEYNVVDSVIRGPGAGGGVGVQPFAGGAAHDNVYGGTREGVLRDGSTAGGFGNIAAPQVVSGYTSDYLVPDIISYVYRMRKPELSYSQYSVGGTATIVVTCPGGLQSSSVQPAEVYMNGRIYRNHTTVVCDLSRTKTPGAATICGMDRGPLTATRAVYIYAVPSQVASATRQFDLVASVGAPTSGPTASATYPVWSWLGAVNTAATVRVVPFRQAGDTFYMPQKNPIMVQLNSPVAALATWRQATDSRIPVGARMIRIAADCASPGLANSQAILDLRVTHGNAKNVNEWEVDIESPSFTSGGSAAQVKSVHGSQFEVGVNASRQFAYLVGSAATITMTLKLVGYNLNRGAFK